MEKLFKFLSIGLLNPLKIIFTIAIIKKKKQPNPTYTKTTPTHANFPLIFIFGMFWVQASALLPSLIQDLLTEH